MRGRWAELWGVTVSSSHALQASSWAWRPPRVLCPPGLQRRPSSRAGWMCKAPGAQWRRTRSCSARRWSSWVWPGSWASKSMLARPQHPPLLGPPAQACPGRLRACSQTGTLGQAGSGPLSCHYCEPGVISHRICIWSQQSRLHAAQAQPWVHKDTTPLVHTSCQATGKRVPACPRPRGPLRAHPSGWGSPPFGFSPYPPTPGSRQFGRSGPGCSVSGPNCWAPSRTF